MDTNRAQEIVSSPVMANVTHNGVPIYIQQVEAQTGIARIYPLDRPDDETEVHVSNLQEQ